MLIQINLYYFFCHLQKLQSQTHICDNNLNFCQKVLLVFPVFSSLCHAPIIESHGTAFSDSSLTFSVWVFWWWLAMRQKIPKMLLPFPRISALLKLEHKF